jgi:xanthine dehydrogenase small subunit
VSVEIPKPLPDMIRFYKVAKRRVDDISTVAAGMAMDRDSAGRVTRARLAFGGVAATPLATGRG